jgi:beta-N-acetylhexosaminidase
VNNNNSIGQKLLLAFDGKEASAEIVSALKNYKPGGLTLYRHADIENPAQVRALTDSLQQIARENNQPPLIIATDQEGGQLTAVDEGTTPLPGNMALGAVNSVELARKAGAVLGRELAAMGVNADYAPVCDVNINPQNPVIGVRSFGEDPEKVGRLAGAMIEGIQSEGVAATAKHFPGHGDTDSDSHEGLFFLPQDLARFRKVEFPPFLAAVNSGVKMMMTAHLALPAVDGPEAPPATLSANILQGLLREDLGFDGVIVTDALDMKAISQVVPMGDAALRASAAGADLLMLSASQLDQRDVFEQMVTSSQNGNLSSNSTAESLKRIAVLKNWISQQPQPGLEVVGCQEHQSVAKEIAERSVTIVRNDDRLLPLSLSSDQKVAVVFPKPEDLTPADTSSYVNLDLAAAVRSFHPHVDQYIISYSPTEAEIAAIRDRLHGYDLLILGTLNAFSSPDQALFVRQVLKLGIPTIVVALRLPYDLIAFPEARTYVCTYSILKPSISALVRAMFGEIEFEGQLPVSIPGMYDEGFSARE